MHNYPLPIIRTHISLLEGFLWLPERSLPVCTGPGSAKEYVVPRTAHKQGLIGISPTLYPQVGAL